MNFKNKLAKRFQSLLNSIEMPLFFVLLILTFLFVKSQLEDFSLVVIIPICSLLLLALSFLVMFLFTIFKSWQDKNEYIERLKYVGHTFRTLLCFVIVEVYGYLAYYVLENIHDKQDLIIVTIIACCIANIYFLFNSYAYYLSKKILRLYNKPDGEYIIISDSKWLFWLPLFWTKLLGDNWDKWEWEIIGLGVKAVKTGDYWVLNGIKETYLPASFNLKFLNTNSKKSFDFHSFDYVNINNKYDNEKSIIIFTKNYRKVYTGKGYKKENRSYWLFKLISYKDGELDAYIYAGEVSHNHLMDTYFSNTKECIIDLAKIYIEKRDYDKAIECYSKAIEKGHCEVCNELADIYINRKQDYEKAIECYNKAIENCSSWWVYSELAEIYAKKEDYDKAIECCNKSIKNGHSLYEAYSDLAKIYAKKQDYGKVIEYSDKAFKEGNSNVYSDLAKIYAEKQDYEKAIECCDKAFKRGKDTYSDIAKIYAKKQNYDKAIECYNKAIEKGNYNVYLDLSRIYAEKQDYDKAIECCDKVFTFEKSYSWAYSNIAKIYAEKQDYEKAIECYNKAIEKGYHGAYSDIAKIYAEKQDYDKAIECYDKAFEKGESWVWVYHDLVKIYVERQNYDKAIECCDRAYEKGYRAAYTNLAEIYVKKLDYDRAIECYNKTIEKGDYSAYSYLVEIYAKKQDYEKMNLPNI